MGSNPRRVELVCSTSLFKSNFKEKNILIASVSV